MESLIYILPVMGLIGLLYTWIKSRWISKQEAGTEKMARIAKSIADGAMAFLKAEYKTFKCVCSCHCGGSCF